MDRDSSGAALECQQRHCLVPTEAAATVADVDKDTRKAKVTDEHRKEAERLRAIWDSRPHPTQAEFGDAQKIGNQSAVGQFLRGEVPLSLNAARGFAKGLGCTIRAFSPRLAKEIDDSREQVGPPSGKRVIALHAEEPVPSGYVSIKESAVRFAGGTGKIAQFDEIDASEPATYRMEWFRKEGVNPKRAKRFKVSGSSMEPLLFDRDTVLVDLSDTTVLDDRVYALRYGEDLRIKRLYRRLDGTLILHSDNPEHRPRDEEVPPKLVAEHITIIGRVRDKSGAGGLN